MLESIQCNLILRLKKLSRWCSSDDAMIRNPQWWKSSSEFSDYTFLCIWFMQYKIFTYNIPGHQKFKNAQICLFCQNVLFLQKSYWSEASTKCIIGEFLQNIINKISMCGEKCTSDQRISEYPFKQFCSSVLLLSDAKGMLGIESEPNFNLVQLF